MQSSNISCYASVDTNPSGLNIFSVPAQHCAKVSFINTYSTDKPTFQVFATINYRTKDWIRNPVFGTHRFNVMVDCWLCMNLEDCVENILLELVFDDGEEFDICLIWLGVRV